MSRKERIICDWLGCHESREPAGGFVHSCGWWAKVKISVEAKTLDTIEAGDNEVAKVECEFDVCPKCRRELLKGLVSRLKEIDEDPEYIGDVMGILGGEATDRESEPDDECPGKGLPW